MIADWLSPVEGNLSTHNSIQKQLEHIASGANTGCLKVRSSEVTWILYFQDGKLTYASHSVELTDRLDRHLRLLGKRVPKITKAVRSEIRQTLIGVDPNDDASPDYRVITTLVSRQYLSEAEAGDLVTGLIEEVLESCLLVTQGTFRYLPALILQPTFCALDLGPLLEKCTHRLQQWKCFAPHVWSPYQRPYFFIQNAAHESVSPETVQKLGQLLKGFSFRHLSVLLNRDEVALTQNLLALIKKQVILVRPPESPFDLLPDLRTYTLPENQACEPPANQDYGSLEAAPPVQKSYTIACVDDSPSILKTIRRYLENDALSIVQIHEPMRALLEIVRAKPDLILMDVGMPKIDGYALCRMLRKHPNFQHVPIIMVTGNTGLIDRAKAKLVGASDYMTKPFTQEELNTMVFRYLSD